MVCYFAADKHTHTNKQNLKITLLIKLQVLKYHTGHANTVAAAMTLNA